MKKASFIFILLIALISLVGLVFLLKTPVYKASQAGGKYCSQACTSDTECQRQFMCFEGFCRRRTCPEKKDCRCERQPCNAGCAYDSDCIDGKCYQGSCRNVGCPTKNDCWCGSKIPVSRPTLLPKF